MAATVPKPGLLDDAKHGAVRHRAVSKDVEWTALIAGVLASMNLGASATLTEEQNNARNTAKILVTSVLRSMYIVPPNTDIMKEASLSPQVLARWGENRFVDCNFRNWCRVAGVSEFNDEEGGINQTSLSYFLMYVLEGHVKGTRDVFLKMLPLYISSTAELQYMTRGARRGEDKLPSYVLIAALFERDADLIFDEHGAFCVDRDSFGVSKHDAGTYVDPKTWYEAKMAAAATGGDGGGGAGGGAGGDGI